MNKEILFLVVSAQVVAFQFVSVRFTRALPDYLVGTEGLPADVEGAADRFKRRAGGLRYALGAVLLIAAVLATFVIGFDRGGSKLALAVISVLSSAALLAGYLHDRHEVAAMAGALPEPATRSALLERRSIGRYYSPVWEWVPVALLLATIGVTGRVISGTAPGESTSTAGLFVLPIMQAIYVLGCLYLSSRYARASVALPQRSRAFHGSPERALELDEALRATELRFFMAVKIAMVLMLGLMQMEKLTSVSGRQAPAWLGVSVWALVAAMLGLFAAYALVSSRVQKKLV
ncbi:MAG: hypothetical protein ACE5JR_10980 [Gemmatimonadota bacterium]